jgi:DNA polymerase-3 subunit epsilon
LSTYIQQSLKSPFTTIYPRYNSWHATQALKQLDNFLVLDCETTGIGKSAEICELAIVDYRSGAVLFNSLIHPYNMEGYEVSKAKEVSGITTQELHHAPPLPQVWSEVLSTLQSKHLTAFNADFDIRMIRNSAIKWGLEVPPLEATCIMKLTTAFLDLDYWLSLQEASEYFCADNVTAHRALADALTTVEIVKRMKAGSSNGKR